MKVIITIPAYNEEKTIGIVINDIKEVMEKNRFDYQIMVIDDGSTDKTKEISEKLGVIVFSHQANYGLAEAFKTEIKKALKLNPDIIVHIDADGQYLATDIPKLINAIEEGYDLVLGSRFKGKIESMPLLKRIGNKIFSKIISNITKLNISDTQTGFRAFTKEVAKKIEITSSFTYTQEQIIRVAKLKFKIREVPIYFAKRKGNTKSRLMKNPFDFAFKALTNVLRIYRDYEPLKFFGFIGLFLILLGLLLGVWIILNVLNTGSTEGIPKVILAALLMLTGLQITIFGFLADMSKKVQ